MWVLGVSGPLPAHSDTPKRYTKTTVTGNEAKIHEKVIISLIMMPIVHFSFVKPKTRRGRTKLSNLGKCGHILE